MASGIKFMMAPKSHKDFRNLINLIIHGMVNAPGSSFFCTKDLVVIAL